MDSDIRGTGDKMVPRSPSGFPLDMAVKEQPSVAILYEDATPLTRSNSSSSAPGDRSPDSGMLSKSASAFHRSPRSPYGFFARRHGSFRRIDEKDKVYRPMEMMDGKSRLNETRREELWKLMSTYIGKDVPTIQRQIVNHVEYTLARTRYNFDNYAGYQATALSVRDRLIESWNDTQQYFTLKNVKRVYYLSLEYLMGRSLQNALINLGLHDAYSEALRGLGHTLEDFYDEERDAALGNGGLGRLAACFMDSLATMDYPAWGYGIRYTYGMFQQQIIDGYQAEFPDYWLTFGNPWDIERLDVFYPVQFYGKVVQFTDSLGYTRFRWDGGETVFAVAYDTPIPGYDTYNTINIRLWSSKPSKEFDLASFNEGDYYKAIEDKQRSENITSVLYPNDNTYRGKELRLKQQYFFSSATLRDIIRRFKKTGRPLTEIPNKVAIQLNDTHPTISIAEMMRILVDEDLMSWDEAWEIATNVFAFTNHTVLPEALEKWSVDLIEKLLPRHMQIIYEINWRFLQQVEQRFPDDTARLARMSIIEESRPKMVRMSHLAIVASHTINGVAEIHSNIIKQRIFSDFYEMWPKKFQNKTNGVTPRRWMMLANPGLSNLLTQWTESDEWAKNMYLLERLLDHSSNPQLQIQWSAIKKQNKQRLANYVNRVCKVQVSANAIFDVQVKRIHEYKRQFLNILGVIARYNYIKGLPKEERKNVVPRVVFFGGKAAPGYAQAKRVIKLINSVGDVINKDPDTCDYLKVVFIPNYNVSLAQIIIPASDLSQHISTAGTEASGTSNMKFAMNGCLIIGTLDGANVEIREEITEDNIFIFGAEAHEVDGARQLLRSGNFTIDPRLTQVIEQVRAGKFGTPDTFEPLMNSLRPEHDFYLVTYDFPSYMDTQFLVDKAYKDQKRWVKMSIESTARMGKFSSDRTIFEYATEVWHVEPCPRPDPYKDENTQITSPSGTVLPHR